MIRVLRAAVAVWALVFPLVAMAQQSVPVVSTAMQTAAVANANGTPLKVTGMGTAVLTVNCATCSGGTQINFEVTQDGTNWVSVAGILSTATTPAYATSVTTAGVTVWTFSVAGYQQLRARISAYSAGTVTVTGTGVALAMRAVEPPASAAAASHYDLGYMAGVTPATGWVVASSLPASTVTKLVGTVAVAAPTGTTIDVYSTPSGTACGSGTKLTTSAFAADGTASTDQTLATTGSISAGNRLCWVAAGTWTGTVGVGTISVWTTSP